MTTTSVVGSVVPETTQTETASRPAIVAVVKKPETEVTFENLVPLLAEKYGVSEPLAMAIIKCESNYVADAYHLNYRDGVHWSTDWGYWQINDYYNATMAKEQGYDVINNWEDNLEYGFIMLKERGTQPWLASKPCWG